MMTARRSRFAVAVVPALLVMAASALAYYKIAFLGYTLSDVIQSESYYLETVIEFDGHGMPVEIEMALPHSLPNQVIKDEAFDNDDMKFDISERLGERRGVWQGKTVDGRKRLGYTATVITKNEKYLIDSTLATRQDIPPAVARYLLPDSAIQSDDPAIAAVSDSLKLSRDSSLLSNAARIFAFAHRGLRYVKYSGTTDALTAYHIGEASCGGKSRLMAALARHLGIPARLVGGKILETGRSTATHIWMEMYVNGSWVPFCPTNNYFAEMPAHYLILYYGDRPLITHTKDINFKYFFNLKKRLVSTSEGLTKLKENPLDILNVWATFKNASISLELLRIIIMLPIGVLAVVLFRNIIGAETFGTFMPALIAIGFRETGLGYGLILFLMIISLGAVVRTILTRFHLLHTPRLAVMLASVVIFMLGLTAVGVSLGFLQLARVALFPMVIMTLTVERFSIITDEFGLRKAAQVSLFTMMVTTVAYLLMSWRFLQAVVITFPEAILLVVALYIYIGRYGGFRLMEYSRFRDLMRLA